MKSLRFIESKYLEIVLRHRTSWYQVCQWTKRIIKDCLKVTVCLTVITTDVDKTSTVAHGENSTQELQPPVNHHEYQDEEKTPHATSKKDDALKFWYPS